MGMSEEEKIVAVSEILERSANGSVREWPKDERDMHRNGDWPSFTERREAMTRYRAEKIITLVAASPVLSTEGVGEETK